MMRWLSSRNRSRTEQPPQAWNATLGGVHSGTVISVSMNAKRAVYALSSALKVKEVSALEVELQERAAKLANLSPAKQRQADKDGLSTSSRVLHRQLLAIREQLLAKMKVQRLYVPQPQNHADRPKQV
eukprot:4014157-Amphidinium_carterae.1